MMGMTETRPLDALDSAKGKRIIVSLKSGLEVVGVLKAFDIHLNLWLEESEKREDGKITKLGAVLVRGDNILLASPQ